MQRGLLVTRHRSVTTMCAVCVVGWALLAASGALAAPQMPDRQQMSALYVIDHNGKNPVDPTELLAYSRPFQKILGGCRMSVDVLTNQMIYLADKASEVGARNVTSLDMLESIARRITWTTQKSCGYVMNLAEGHLEAGVH
jgi:hypothetical protein